MVGKGWCLLLPLVAIAGCASPSNYVERRAADFADIFAAELTVGPGVDIHASATRYFGTVLGFSPQFGYLVHGRHFGLGSRMSFGILLAGRSLANIAGRSLADIVGYAVEVPATPAGQQKYAGRGWGWALLLAEPEDSDITPEWPSEGLGVWDFDVGASCIVGIHVGFNPAELLDFILGFTTLDIGSDDHVPAVEPLAPAPEEDKDDQRGGRFGWTPVHEVFRELNSLFVFVLLGAP